MPFVKGVKPNKAVGIKGRSGRKSNAEYVAGFKEQLKQEALAEIANRVVGRRLKMLDEANGEIAFVNLEKEFALPIALKGMTEKIDHTTKGEKITDNPEILKLTNLLNAIHSRTSEPSDGESTSPLGEEIPNKE